jgi:hypothetical protein
MPRDLVSEKPTEEAPKRRHSQDIYVICSDANYTSSDANVAHDKHTSDSPHSSRLRVPEVRAAAIRLWNALADIPLNMRWYF